MFRIVVFQRSILNQFFLERKLSNRLKLGLKELSSAVSGAAICVLTL